MDMKRTVGGMIRDLKRFPAKSELHLIYDEYIEVKTPNGKEYKLDISYDYKYRKSLGITEEVVS